LTAVCYKNASNQQTIILMAHLH